MKEVIDFIKKYKDFYPEYFINDRLKKCKYGYTCDVDQIYCHLSKIDITTSVYYNFYNLSLKYFNIKDLKLLEVCSGYIPILSSIYKENGINIEALNKRILFKDYKDIKTIEFDLNNEYDLSDYDLIVGIRPCDVTKNIIDYCYKYKKDFMIYLCPCIHEPKTNIKTETYDDWINYLKEKTSSFKNYKIKFIKEKNFPDDCPIIIGIQEKENK